ncbi:MAG: ABC transporter transmembrane domain-containing protein, partial [Treponema sp.]|nr:ABC transporter transmembrane domain-containing protein [Treponema sp.]
MFKITRFLKPFTPLLVLAVCFLLLQAFCDLTLPNLMSQLVNMILSINGTGTGSTTNVNSGILSLGLRMLFTALTGGASAIMVSFMSTRIAAGIARDLRHAVFQKVESFTSREFDDFSTASLITRCTNDITNV